MRTGCDPNSGIDCTRKALEVHIVLKDCVCADTMLSSPTKSNRQQDLPPAGVVQGNCSLWLECCEAQCNTLSKDLPLTNLSTNFKLVTQRSVLSSLHCKLQCMLKRHVVCNPSGV